jgi:pimeloyl-ACP methyl ester carboxylesterase
MSDLHWHDTGSGRPLVLLHGGFLDHRMWEDQIPAFAADHRVIAPDFRGHGRSPNASGPYRHGDDVAALLRHLDTGPAVLVGLSMGGGIAVDVALDHPDLVEAVIVSGTGTSEPEFTDPWTNDVLDEFGALLGTGRAEPAIDAFMAFTTGPSRTLDDVDPDVVRRLHEMMRDSFAKHTVGEPEFRIPPERTWERVPGITVPLHAVNGDLDSPDHIALAERAVALAGTGTAHLVEGTAHYPNMERPERFNTILRDLLSTR